jgi:hypothetical protein
VIVEHGAGAAPRRRVSPRWLLIGGAAVVVVIVVGAAYALLHHNHHKAAAKRPALPTSTAQLDTGGLALASLLTSGRNETYHARYTSTANPTVSGGTVTLEAWNTQGKSRVDTTSTTKDGKVIHTASILNAGKAFLCEQPAGGAWTCRTVAPPAEGDPIGLVASLNADLSGRAVTEHADKIVGQPARCFHISALARAEAIDACVTHQGVLLRVMSSEARIEVAKLDASVPGKEFDPPAKPTG